MRWITPSSIRLLPMQMKGSAMENWPPPCAMLPAAQLSSRVAAGRLGGLGLGCLWRSSVEAIVASARPFWATSYQRHEPLPALPNPPACGEERSSSLWARLLWCLRNT